MGGFVAHGARRDFGGEEDFGAGNVAVPDGVGAGLLAAIGVKGVLGHGGIKVTCRRFELKLKDEHTFYMLLRSLGVLLDEYKL